MTPGVLRETMMNQEPKPRKTEFFAGIMFLLFSGAFLWPALHGRTTIFKGAPVFPWQSACAGTVLLVIGIILIVRSLRLAFRLMQNTTDCSVAQGGSRSDPCSSDAG